MDHFQLPDNIPVDDDYARFAETLDDDDGDTSAFSIASTRYNFRWENGRLYQDYRNPGPFPYLDDLSQENEQVLHSMVLYILEDNLIAAPVRPENLGNILDVGTGMGLWAEDIADRYENCQVLGVDTQPHETSVRPNCRFECFDVSNDWILDSPNLKFDFIHIRSLFASLRLTDWPVLYGECMK
jgi:hypothetical protein